MSEFKYACPVCGQHIKCDSSQAGSVMECPTCYQKITVPQAPASEDQKFILTGSRAEEKRPTTLVEAAGRTPRRTRSFPVAAALFFLALFLAIAAGFHFYGGQIAQWLGHWKTFDVGSVGVPGSVSRAGKIWTVAGSGRDIWGQSDEFHFVCRPASGDLKLRARVLSLERTDPWAKAGLMVRESPAPDSAYAMVMLTANSGVAFQQRSRTGSEATSVLIVPGVQAPCWMRLVRQKDVFAAEYSADGNSWISLGTNTLSMPPDVWAGLAVTAHSYSALCQAKFDEVAMRDAKSHGQAANSLPQTPPGAAHDLAAPPANDSNWVPVLNHPAIPDTPVAGRIHDQDFIAERASFQNNSLVLLGGKHGADFAAVIDFGGASPEELAGKAINVSTNTEKAAKVTLRWKDDAGNRQSPSYSGGYALRLEFGTFENNSLPGKIYI